MASAQTSWYRLNSGTTAHLGSVYFIDDDTGYVGGYNLILKTTNGGATWSRVSLDSNGLITNLQFLDSRSGFAIGDGGILKTTDAGQTWLQNQSPCAGSISIVDSLIGYGSGNFDCIMKTFDGGLTWYPLAPGVNGYHFNSLHFRNRNLGFVVGGFSAEPDAFYVIRKTTNGGISWSTVHQGGGFILQVVHMVNESTAYAVGGRNILKTSDQGATWSIMSQHQYEYFNAIHFLNADSGFVAGWYFGSVESGRILRTVDGGMSWQYSLLYDSVRFWSVFFPSANIGYAVGTYGTVMKTTNGGLTWVAQDRETPRHFLLEQNYPNPFNPTTKFEVRIAEFVMVTLKVYDVLGREVATLINEVKQSGRYEVVWDAHKFASGVYYYRLTTGKFTQTKKLLLLK